MRNATFEVIEDDGSFFGWIPAIHNKIASFIRGIEANLGSRSYIAPDSRTLSADAKKSESPRWR